MEHIHPQAEEFDIAISTICELSVCDCGVNRKLFLDGVCGDDEGIFSAHEATLA